MRTFWLSHVTVSSVQTLDPSVTLLVSWTPPVTQASLRFAPTPSAQPSPAGFPCAAIPACWPRARRSGLTQSSTVPLDWSTVPVIELVLVSATPLPASTNGPPTPSAGLPTYVPSRSFGDASCATVEPPGSPRRRY